MDADTVFICAGEDANLGVEAINNCTPVDYMWDMGGGPGEDIVVSPATTTTYTVTVTETGVCAPELTGTTVVVVNPNPEAGTASVNPIEICLGESADLNLAGFVGNIQWQESASSGGPWTDIPGATGPDFTVTPTTTTFYQAVVTNSCGTEISNEVSVSVFGNPVADFEFEINGISSADGLTGGCYLNTVNFIDGSSVDPPGVITSWFWQFGDGNTSTDVNPDHNYGSAGTYTVSLTVTTGGGCDSTITMTVVMTDDPDITIIQNDPTCFGYSDGSFTILISGGSGGPGAIFEIMNEDGEVINIGGSNTVNSLAEGTYTYSVEDNGCDTDGTVIIDDPDPLEIEMDLGHVACHGDATGYAIADTVYNAQGPKDLIVYIWSTGENGPALDSIGGLVAGEYELDITDSAGCAGSTTFTITEPPALEFSEIGYEPAYCRLYSYQSGSGQVYAAATGGTPDYTYLWENLGTGATSINTTWGGLNPGDYEITVTDNNGCILTQIIVLDSLNPFSEFDVVSQQLNANLEGTATVCVDLINQSMYFTDEDADSDGDSTFWWNFNYPDAQTTLHQDAEYYTVFDTCYAEGGTYEICLKIQNKNGCEHETCKTITVFDPLKVVPPNIFTPDGDGVNDVFTFGFLAKGVQTFHCTIVNRWGVKMAEIDDIASGWDGTDRNGSVCRDGTYFYIYEGTSEAGEPFSGQGTVDIIGSGK
jgi:gliding motility-associated-like protein